MLHDPKPISRHPLTHPERDDVERQLRADNERLRAALKPFSDKCVQLSRAHLNGGPDDEEICVDIGWLRDASAALEPKP